MAPNILWLMSDQHNASCLGTVGRGDARTPDLDALARDDVRRFPAISSTPTKRIHKCGRPWSESGTGITTSANERDPRDADLGDHADALSAKRRRREV